MPDSAIYARSSAKSAVDRSRTNTALAGWQDACAVSVMFTFTVVLLWPLVCGRSLYWGDIGLYFEPMQRFAASELRSNRLPLWNPYLLCGQPFLGNPQMAVFYPLSIAAPFMSASHYLSLSTFIHMFLCGLFMYCYLRRWVHFHLSALCASLCYMGSTCIVARIQFPPMIVSAAYCPLILFMLDACLDSLTMTRYVGLSVAVGLLVLSAHPQMAYFSLLIACIYAIYRIYNRSAASDNRVVPLLNPSYRRSVRTLLTLAGSGCLGLTLAAGQLAPMIELMRVSTRERMTPTLANRFVFDLSHLATLIFPNFFGHPAQANYFGGGNAWEPGIFIGWVPLLAVLYGAARLHRMNEFKFWAAVGVISLWLSTGTAGGLFWAAFYVVPGLSNFHDPARFLFITTVCISVLTCFGIDVWLRIAPARQNWIPGALILATSGPLIWFGIAWNPTTGKTLNQSSAHRHVSLSGRSYLPAHELYWRRYVTEGYSDYGSEATPAVILNADIPNVQMREGIETAAGYEPVPISAPAEVDGLTRLAYKRDEPTFESLIRLMDVTQILLPDYQNIYSSTLHATGGVRTLRSDETIQILTSPVYRAWLTKSALHVEGKTRVEAAIAGPDFNPYATSVVSGLGPSQHLAEPEQLLAGSLPPGIVHIVSESTTAVSLDVIAPDTSNFLVYSATCYPGWKATVDQKPAELYCADGAFLGLEIPGGRHVVTLVYAPGAVRAGIFFMAAGLMACAAFVSYSVFRFQQHSSLNANIFNNVRVRAIATSEIDRGTNR